MRKTTLSATFDRKLSRLFSATDRRRGQAASTGASVGATLGSMLGGPVGAAIGGALGAVAGVLVSEVGKR